jgi:hypothetical protein
MAYHLLGLLSDAPGMVDHSLVNLETQWMKWLGMAGR